jgi:hypothetical protein
MYGGKAKKLYSLGIAHFASPVSDGSFTTIHRKLAHEKRFLT